MLRNAVLVVAGAFVGCASPQDSTEQRETALVDVPSTLVPDGKEVLLTARAEGVQIYVAEETGGKLGWALKAPNAVLLDYRTGDKVGTHTMGPTWTDQGGSRLTGEKLASEDAPDSNAIPWLLLAAKPENGGRFSRVTHIQRLHTWGGKAPAAAPTTAGETREVRYEATYVFLGDR